MTIFEIIQDLKSIGFESDPSQCISWDFNGFFIHPDTGARLHLMRNKVGCAFSIKIGDEIVTKHALNDAQIEDCVNDIFEILKFMPVQ